MTSTDKHNVEGLSLHKIYDHYTKQIDNTLPDQLPINETLVPYQDRTRESVFDMPIVSKLMMGKYKHKWKSEDLMKDAVSLDLYSTMIQLLKPKIIFDCGTFRGGSALWFYDQLETFNLQDSLVISIDLFDYRTQNCKSLMKEKKNLCFIEKDISDINKSDIESFLKGPISNYHPWLIAEDYHAGAENILPKFERLGMKYGDYIVFEDTHLDNPNNKKEFMDSNGNYEPSEFSLNKLTNLEKFMDKHPQNYLVDTFIQDYYGYNGATHINSVLVCNK